MSRMNPKAPVPHQVPSGHSFSRVPSANIQRSKFDFSATDHTVFDAGLLIPIYNEEVLPGDTWQMQLSMLIRYATLNVPIMDSTFVDVHWWFIPNRLVWTHWVNFMGEQTSTDFVVPGTYTVPTIQLPHALTSPYYEVLSLYDYLGYPIPPFSGGGSVGPEVDALDARSYYLVYDTWYRDQNLIDPIFPTASGSAGDGPDSPGNYVLQRRGKRHDYFTGGLPWAQKGDAVTIPFADSDAPVTGTFGFAGPASMADSNWLVGLTSGATSYLNWEGNATAPKTNTASGTPSSGEAMGVNYNSMNFDVTVSGVGLTADLSSATLITINSLRQGIAVQQLLERDARGGTRYIEVLASHFAVVSPDARLQRPEFLGSSSAVVGVYSVPQSTPASGGSTAQGYLAAFGIASPNSGGFTHSFVEHGTILGILSVRAPYTYTQGLRRKDTRQTRYDYYWPTFAMLGEQATLNQEICFQGVPGTGASQDQGAFNWQERWAEYRYRPNRATGLFRTNVADALVQWELAQNFASLPTFAKDFIEENPPTDQVVVVEEQDGPAFKADLSFKTHVTRALPVYSVPGLLRL